MKDKIQNWLLEGNFQLASLPVNDQTDYQIRASINNMNFIITKPKGKGFIIVGMAYYDPKIKSILEKQDKTRLKEVFLNARRILLENYINFNFINMDTNRFIFERVVFESNLIFLEDLTATLLFQTIDKVRSVFQLFLDTYLSSFNIDPTRTNEIVVPSSDIEYS